MISLLKTLFCLSFVVPYVFGQDHTQCADSGSDWYTSVVGETPCRTYERLRQLCNSQYVLGALNPNTPPDTCDDQIADCCCNSIAFGLSMLCLTCQQGIGNGNGIDAGVGAYQLYLKHGTNSFCTPNTNLSFTTGIQAAVCNNELKIHNSFYDRVFWSDGSWFYTWSREQMETTNAADGNNSFTHCASTTVNVTSSSQSQSTLRSESTLLPQSTSLPQSTTPLSQSTSTSTSLSTSLSQSTSTSPPPSTSLSQSTSLSLAESLSLSRSQTTSLSQSTSNTTLLTESSAASATSTSTLPHSSKSLTAGAIAGVAVGSIAFVGAITLFLIWLCSYRRRQSDVEDSEMPTPFTIGHTPSMSHSAGTPTLTTGSGAGRRLRMKEQMESPPRYTE